MWPNPRFSADFVTFTEEILGKLHLMETSNNGKLHFLCSVLKLERLQKIYKSHG